MAFLARSASKIVALGGATKCPVAMMEGLSGFVPSRSMSSDRRPPTTPGRTFTLKSHDKQSLDEEYEQQGKTYQEFRRKEGKKEEKRYQQYMRNMRRRKFHESLFGLKEGITKLEKTVTHGFKRTEERFDEVDARFGTTDDAIATHVVEASELASSDLLELLFLLEVLIADLEHLQETVELKDDDQFLKILDMLPTLRNWYLLAVGFEVIVDAGCSLSDLFHILTEAHKSSVEDMKGRIDKFRK